MSRFGDDDFVWFLCLSFGDELKEYVRTNRLKHGIKQLMLDKIKQHLHVQLNPKKLNQYIEIARDWTQEAMKRLSEEDIELDLWRNYDQIVDFNERHK